MLDIDALRLTEDERLSHIDWTPYAKERRFYEALADAQLAKALDGFEIWLWNRWMAGATFSDVIGDLEQANIERPTDSSASPSSAEAPR